MKHIILDEHSYLCPCHKDRDNDKKHWFSHSCKLNPDRFLFFLDNDFHIITYFNCKNHGDQYDYKKGFIEAIMGQSKKIHIFETRRGREVENDLKESRLRGVEFDMYIDEINYVYSNNCNKEYAIATKIPLVDKLEINDVIDKNYMAALDFIKNDKFLKGYKFLYDELEYLKFINKVSISDAEIVKSTAHLSKIFRKKIKEKQKLTTNN